MEREIRERVKSPLRMKYEAEVEVIQKQVGDLTRIQGFLGLSGRKICQLLLVDPSAWNRWTQGKTPVPPHIYRALQWYLALQEKVPGLQPSYWLGRVPNPEAPSGKQLLALQEEFQELREKLEEEKRQRHILTLICLGLFAGFIAMGFF